MAVTDSPQDRLAVTSDTQTQVIDTQAQEVALVTTEAQVAVTDNGTTILLGEEVETASLIVQASSPTLVVTGDPEASTVTLVSTEIAVQTTDTSVAIIESGLAGPQGVAGPPSLFVQATAPNLPSPHIWIQPNGSGNYNLYFSDGA